MKKVIVRCTGAGPELETGALAALESGLLSLPSMALLTGSVVHTVLFSLPTYAQFLLPHNLIWHVALAMMLSRLPALADQW